MQACFATKIGQIRPFWSIFYGGGPVRESLTRGKPGKKESPRLPGQNRRMFPAMRAIRQTPCERVHVTLTLALLAACAANVALVCAWL